MNKIAIVGMSCLLPGASTPEEYWQNLIDRQNLTSLATAEQMGVNPNLFYSSHKGELDKYYCLRGGFVRDFQFDPTGYNLSPEILHQLDPLYQWSLYTAKQALQDSGYLTNNDVLANCGVILGNLSFPTRSSHHLFAPIYHQALNSAIRKLLGKTSFEIKPRVRDAYPLNGNISSYPATLISQALDLSKANFTLDAACASSLYSIKLACDYLLNHKADLMLAGAVSCGDPFFINMGFSIFQAYPENDNHVSNPLDESSKGLIAGEGAGMLVLKRYQDAVNDGDRIYATIEGIGLSNDGKGKFVLAPNSKGQVLALSRAYRNAGIDPKNIDYIECHATGTPVGDIVELDSMESFFGRYAHSPLLGSVKSSVGHLLTAAGVASLIKLILSLNKNLIPPTININNPLKSGQGNIGGKNIVTSSLNWQKPQKFAGVSAFGFGGCNAHLVLSSNSNLSNLRGFRGLDSLRDRVQQFAIIGMDVHFGDCDGLAAFDRTIRQNQAHFIPLPSQRWQGLEIPIKPQGAYIADFEFDFLRYKIPPNLEDRLIPQQLLMLKVADRAIQDAGLQLGQNVAVIVAMETELALHQYRGRVDLDWQIKQALQESEIDLDREQIATLETIAKDSLHSSGGVNYYTSTVGNIMASRIAALWDFTGAAFTVSAGERSVFQALSVAQMMLANGEVEAVVLGAVDLAGGIESVWLHHLMDANSKIPLGEGAGAIVLQRHSSAVSEGDGKVNQNLIYALIDARSGKNEQTDLGYLEICGSGVYLEDNQIANEVLQTYQHSNYTNLGTVQANIGHHYAASGMASLIKAALCLGSGYYPDSQDKPLLFTIQGIDRTETYANLTLIADLDNHSRDRKPPVANTSDRQLINTVILGGKSIRSTILSPKNLSRFKSFAPNQSNKITMLDRTNQIQQHNHHQEDLKIIQLQIARSQQLQPDIPKAKQTNYSKPSNIIWNEADLLEFAEGNIVKVFGDDYAIIDSYSRRVRLPTPPYLLVSRVTKIDAQKGSFKPSSMTTEYDIPVDAWYTVDGQIPLCVAVESGQCDLLLISYLGIDFENKGNLVYRLLDCTLTFLEDLPREGETLRYDIKINSFVRNGDNLLFFFSYECFVGDKMVLKMDGGCAGFFDDEQLEQGKGIIVSDRELAARKQIKPQRFTPLLVCHKSSFDRADILHLTRGDLAACFGDSYAQYALNPALRLPPPEILMLDRVTSIDLQGGAWGLGLIIGEKNLAPEHWYFPCHFKDDQVMPGSLVAEGCSHLLEFYMLYLGLHLKTKDARFQPIFGLPKIVRCRGQITPVEANLIYRMEITEIGLTPYPYVKCNVDIILQSKTVVGFQDLGLQIKEKRLPGELNNSDRLYSSTTTTLNSSKPALLTQTQIEEFCLGSIAKCFGEEFAIYDRGDIKASRMPNTHLNLVSRVLEVRGQRHQIKPGSTIITEYDVPTAPWYYQQNSSNTTPYSILMEMALQPCGFLSAYLGTTLLYPDSSLYFRNLDGLGHLLEDIDLRGKVVTNTSTLLSSTNISGIILQSFRFELACDNRVFYQGKSSFGHFNPKALAEQVGLDRGEYIHPWYESQSNLATVNLDLRQIKNRDRYYQINPAKPGYRLANHQLDLLNNVKLIKAGGTYQQGYIFAEKKINLIDWYFKCHFHEDPVMPGSLGLEAMIQAMQIYVLHFDLANQFQSPCFVNLNQHETVWKYRGQILHSDQNMFLEVHISQVKISADKIVVIGDASLWKPQLRIYEVKDLAVCLQPFLVE